jgi:hypothetical protein
MQWLKSLIINKQGTKYLRKHKELLYKVRSLDQASTNDHTTEKSRHAFKPDQKFIKVCMKIAYTPNYQYHLLQLSVVPRNIFKNYVRRCRLNVLSDGRTGLS